jgi:hypothetical protein
VSWLCPADSSHTGDTAWAATSDEVKDLRRETGALKEVVAELVLEAPSRCNRQSPQFG